MCVYMFNTNLLTCSLTGADLTANVGRRIADDVGCYRQLAKPFVLSVWIGFVTLGPLRHA